MLIVLLTRQTARFGRLPIPKTTRRTTSEHISLVRHQNRSHDVSCLFEGSGLRLRQMDTSKSFNSPCYTSLRHGVG